MNPNCLDLAVHGPEMIAGKLIVISSTEYIVGDLIQEPNGARVYPLRNLQSGFSWFIGRFEKTVHAPKDANDSDRFRQIDFATFLMALSGFPVVQTETHDLPGGLVQIRRAMEAPSEDAFHPDLMRKGSEAMDAARWQEAKEIYSSALAQNPNHHSAMLNLAGCLLYLNDPLEALSVIVRAAEVEPNDPQIHQQTAVVFRTVAMAAQALDSLDHTLARFRWDAGSWRLKADISRQYGLAPHLLQMLAEIDGFDPTEKPGLRTFIEELQSGLREAQALTAQFTDAIEHQQQGAWPDALQIWESIGPEHLHSLNRLNLLICKFHVGRIDEVAEETLPLLYCLPVPLHKLTCAGLALVANTGPLRREHALNLARLLSLEVSDSADLPGIPQAVSLTGEVKESGSGQLLIDALERLGRDCSAPEDASMLAGLVALYHERERKFATSDLPPSTAKARCWKLW